MKDSLDLTLDFDITDKANRLLDVIAILKNSERIGSDVDDPEGTRYIQVSDTLVGIMLEKLASLLVFRE